MKGPLTSSTGRNAQLYTIAALSPIHIGVGEGLSAINLPTAREAHTGYPLIPGSSVKGVLRQHAELALGARSGDVLKAFGPASENAGDHRGGLVFSDASLVAFPVRSLWGTFAYVSCPFVIGRLLRDLAETPVGTDDATGWLSSAERALSEKADAVIATGSALRTTGEGPLYLEDYELRVGNTGTEAAGKLGDWLAGKLAHSSRTRELFKPRWVMIRDDLFGMLTQQCTEVRHRVKINDETGTAADSGPWTEEYVPAETLFAGVIVGRTTAVVDKDAEKPRKVDAAESLKVMTELAKHAIRLRFGGMSTVGMGQAMFAIVANAEPPQEGVTHGIATVAQSHPLSSKKNRR